MRHYWRFVVMGIVLAGVLVGLGQIPAAQAQTTGQITGFVYETNGSTPIPNAKVEAWNKGTNLYAGFTLVGTDGSYTLALPPGQYQVWAGAAGRTDEFYDDAGFWWANATLITVLAGADRSDVDFTLDPAGTISGTVYNATGTAGISSAYVCFEDYYTGDKLDCEPVQIQANGSYTFGTLPTGEYRVVAAAPGYTLEYWNESGWNKVDADPVSVTAPNDTPNIDFTLDFGGAIQGTITESDGTTPVEAVFVQAHFGTGTLWGGCTEANGTYTIPGLPFNVPITISAAVGFNYCNGPEHYRGRWWDNAVDEASATAIQLTATPSGALRSGIDISLPRNDAACGYATRIIEWAGRSWYVKDGDDLGPGPNDWSDNPQSVKVDDLGRLHLKIREHQGTWYSAEICSVEPVGYGMHRFEVDVPALNENVVLGLFAYADDTHEIDVEYAKWGVVADTNNAQYVVQPYTTAGNMIRFPIANGAATHYFNWCPDAIQFRGFTEQSLEPLAPANLAQEWLYTGPDVPSQNADLHMHLNLWLIDPPSDSQEVEVIVTDYNNLYVAPDPVAPVHLDVIDDDTPTFDWSAAPNAAYYQLQVDNVANFSSPEINMMLTGTDYTPANPLPDGRYYWRVRLVNCVGAPSAWTTVRQFMLDAAPPDAPQLRVPRDRSSTPQNPTRFVWAGVRGAVQYRLQVATEPTFSAPVIDTTTTVPLYTPAASLDYDVYWWRVMATDSAGNTSPWSSIFQYTLTLLRSPRNADHVATTTPRLIWTPVAGAIEYYVQVDDADDFITPVYEYTGLPYTTITTALAGGEHWWRVQVDLGAGYADNWTPAWTFTVTPPLPTRPRLIAPLNGALLDIPTPTFEWEAVTDGYQYQIQVDRRGNFLSPEVDEVLAPGVLTYLLPDPLPDGGRWFWRVRAINQEGAAGLWSARWLFTLNELLPPVLTGPTGVTTDNTVEVTWDALADAASYQIEIDNDPRFGSPEAVGESTSSPHPFGTPLPDDRYYVRVRGVSATGIPGRWSRPLVFTVDTTGPDAPTPRVPANRHGTPDTTPSLVWRASRGAAGYQLQVDPVADADTCYSHTFAAPLIDVATVRPVYVVPAVDALNYGVYCWRVMATDLYGNDGPWSDPSAFYVSVMRAPRDGFGSVNRLPVFVWLYVPGTTSCTFELFAESDLVTPIETYTGPLLAFRMLTLMDYGTYFWQVECGGTAMPMWELIITPRPPARARQVAPRSGTLTNDTTPTLYWQAVAGGQTYQVQIDADAAFGSPDQDVTGGVGDLTYTADPLADGRWYWRVRPINEYGVPGPWSARWFFTVDTVPPDVPVLTRPVDGATITNRMLTLAWDRIRDARRYEIQVDVDPGFPLPPIDVGARFAYRMLTPISRGTYYWRARAIDRAGNVSAWSDPRSFEVVAGVTLNESGEAMPPLVEAESKWVQMTGYWSAEDSPENAGAASGAKFLVSSGRDVDDVLALAFEGTGVTVVFVKDPAYGRLGIEIDGALVQVIECFDVTGRTFGAQVTFNGLAAGSHTIRVFPVVGRVAVDAFVIE